MTRKFCTEYNCKKKKNFLLPGLESGWCMGLQRGDRQGDKLGLRCGMRLMFSVFFSSFFSSLNVLCLFATLWVMTGMESLV